MASSIVIFESEDENVSMEVGFDGDTVWLSQAQMVTLFGTTKQNVSLHLMSRTTRRSFAILM